MNKVYKIFLAGSTKLENERSFVRNVISEWVANDDVTTKQLDGSNIIVYAFDVLNNVVSWDGNTQQESYNEFIQNTADLVIFILCGEIGEETYKEFQIAYNRLRETKTHPLILVYAKNNSNDKRINEVKVLLQQHGKYYHPYNNDDELKHILMQDLSHFVEIKKKEQKDTKKKRMRRIVLPAIFSLFCVLSLFAIHYIPQYKAIKYAQEALVYCENNEGVHCYNRLKKAEEYLDKAGVSKNHPIVKKINEKIHK